jgi:hypothetical protein
MENADIYNQILMHKIINNEDITDEETIYTNDDSDIDTNDDSDIDTNDDSDIDTNNNNNDKQKIIELEKIIKRIMKKNRLLYNKIEYLEKQNKKLKNLKI